MKFITKKTCLFYLQVTKQSLYHNPMIVNPNPIWGLHTVEIRNDGFHKFFSVLGINNGEIEGKQRGREKLFTCTHGYLEKFPLIEITCLRAQIPRQISAAK